MENPKVKVLVPEELIEQIAVLVPEELVQYKFLVPVEDEEGFIIEFT